MIEKSIADVIACIITKHNCKFWKCAKDFVQIENFRFLSYYTMILKLFSNDLSQVLTNIAEYLQIIELNVFRLCHEICRKRIKFNYHQSKVSDKTASRLYCNNCEHTCDIAIPSINIHYNITCKPIPILIPFDCCNHIPIKQINLIQKLK